MLDLACLRGHAECVETLLLQGATILVQDSTTRRTPLHSAGEEPQPGTTNPLPTPTLKNPYFHLI